MAPRMVAVACAGLFATGCSPAPEANEPEAPPPTEVAVASPSASSAAPLPDAPVRSPPRVRRGAGETVIDGVVFRTVTRPVKLDGGWGLDIAIEARSGDGIDHRVGTQLHISGKSWKVSEGQVGLGGFGTGGTNSLLAVTPEAPRELTLSYPGAHDWKPVAAGWTLELDLRTSLMARSGDIEQVTVGRVRLEVSDANEPKVSILPPEPREPD